MLCWPSVEQAMSATPAATWLLKGLPPWALQALAALRQLRHLGLSSCPAAHVAALPALVAALPCLTRLDLNDLQIGDGPLSAILQVTHPRLHRLRCKCTAALNCM